MPRHGSAAAAADEAERLRRLPPSLIDEVTEADLWRLVMPTGLGGHGLGITELAHGTRRLAQGCPASAWTISFLVMHSWLLTKFGEAARAEFFAEQPWALAPAPLAPTGTLTAVDGGYRVSGRWEWATGVHHGEWVMVHAVQTEPEFATGSSWCGWTRSPSKTSGTPRACGARGVTPCTSTTCSSLSTGRCRRRG
ncbi:MAG: acyl-CoA dehydrogenase family protein [Acidimicrobiales bacterium]